MYSTETGLKGKTCEFQCVCVVTSSCQIKGDMSGGKCWQTTLSVCLLFICFSITFVAFSSPTLTRLHSAKFLFNLMDGFCTFDDIKTNIPDHMWATWAKLPVVFSELFVSYWEYFMLFNWKGSCDSWLLLDCVYILNSLKLYLIVFLLS